MPGRKGIRRSLLGVADLLGLLTAAAPAHAVADTTRASLRDALAAGCSPRLITGRVDRTLLRFRVAGYRASRLAPYCACASPIPRWRACTSARFHRGRGTPAILIFSLFAVARLAGATAGTWAQRNVTSAVAWSAASSSVTWRRRTTCATGHWGSVDPHASQPSIVSVPDGGFVLAVERDTPDPQWVGTSNIVVRRYATWAALVAGS